MTLQFNPMRCEQSELSLRGQSNSTQIPMRCEQSELSLRGQSNSTQIPMRCEQSELSLRGKLFYTYVLTSKKDDNYYVGSCDDINARLREHNIGRVQSTKHRRPLKIIYYEACLSRGSARKRENYLKTSWGKRYLKTRTQQ